MVLFYMIVGTFQSTPSVWRATQDLLQYIILISISIHALRVEGDILSPCKIPCRTSISIHALRVEGDADLLRGFGP